MEEEELIVEEINIINYAIVLANGDIIRTGRCQEDLLPYQADTAAGETAIECGFVIDELFDSEWYYDWADDSFAELPPKPGDWAVFNYSTMAWVDTRSTDRNNDFDNLHYTLNVNYSVIPATNRFNWLAGTVVRDNGRYSETKTLAAGFITWTSGPQLVYYDWVTNTIAYTTDISFIFAQPYRVFIGEYRGGDGFTDALNGFIVNGNKLISNSLETRHLKSNTITTDKLASNSVTTEILAANAVTANNIVTGAVTVGKIAANAVTANTIAANTITTNHIVSGSITTIKFAANSVTTAVLAADAVTANNIVAGAVTVGKIATNAVVANNIVAGAVTVGKIATNAVVANNISAGAVTVGKIAADAVTANTIATNAIQADHIGADTLTVRHLVIGDMTNLVPDADMADRLAWVMPAAWIQEISGPVFKGTHWFYYNVAANQTGNSGRVLSKTFSVDAGMEYAASFQARTQSSSENMNLICEVQWLKTDGSFISWGRIGDNSGTGFTNNATLYKRDLVAPAEATRCRFTFYVNNPDSVGRIYVGSPEIRRKTGGDLIINGSVVTDNMRDNAVTELVALDAPDYIGTSSTAWVNAATLTFNIPNNSASVIYGWNYIISTTDAHAEARVVLDGVEVKGSREVVGIRSLAQSNRTFGAPIAAGNHTLRIQIIRTNYAAAGSTGHRLTEMSLYVLKAFK